MTTDMPSKAEFHDALARVFAKVKRASKDRNNPAFKSRYATLAAVCDACEDALNEHEFAYPQEAHTVVSEAAVECVVETVLLWKGHEYRSGKVTIPLARSATAQQIGSAFTYARRYSLSATLAVCPDDDDDDGNAASKAARHPREHAPDRRPEPEPDRLWMAYEAARDAAAKHLRILGPQAHQRILHLAEVQHGNDPNDAEVKRMIDCAEALLLTDPAPSSSKPAAKAEPAKATTAKSKATPSAKASAEPAEPRDVQAARKATDSAYRAYQDTCKEEGVAERPWMDIAYHAIGKAWDIKQGSHGVEDYERLAAAYEDEIDRVRKGEGAK